MLCTFLTSPLPPLSALFPYTTLFRSDFRSETKTAMSSCAPGGDPRSRADVDVPVSSAAPEQAGLRVWSSPVVHLAVIASLALRSEEHTSELQSHSDLVCRLLLEKKKY